MLAGNVLTYCKTNKTEALATHAGITAWAYVNSQNPLTGTVCISLEKSEQGTAKMPHADIWALATICSISSCTYTSFNFRVLIIITFLINFKC